MRGVIGVVKMSRHSTWGSSTGQHLSGVPAGRDCEIDDPSICLFGTIQLFFYLIPTGTTDISQAMALDICLLPPRESLHPLPLQQGLPAGGCLRSRQRIFLFLLSLIRVNYIPARTNFQIDAFSPFQNLPLHPPLFFSLKSTPEESRRVGSGVTWCCCVLSIHAFISNSNGTIYIPVSMLCRGVNVARMPAVTVSDLLSRLDWTDPPTKIRRALAIRNILVKSQPLHAYQLCYAPFNGVSAYFLYSSILPSFHGLLRHAAGRGPVDRSRVRVFSSWHSPSVRVRSRAAVGERRIFAWTIQRSPTT